MNLHEKVQMIPKGAIFQVGDKNGVPWMKGEGDTVIDLYRDVLLNRHKHEDTIPDIWRRYDFTVHVIYTPTTQTEEES